MLIEKDSTTQQCTNTFSQQTNVFMFSVVEIVQPTNVLVTPHTAMPKTTIQFHCYLELQQSRNRRVQQKEVGNFVSFFIKY
jgi:hypothetical protein